MKKLYILSLVIFVVSCTPNNHQKFIEMEFPIYQRLSDVDYDRFDKSSKYSAPPIFNNVHQNARTNYFIRGWKLDKSKVAKHQIYVLLSYAGDWRYYNRAVDSDGKNFKLTEIDQDVACFSSSCNYYETVGISVDAKYLKSKTDGSGMTMRIYSRKGGDIDIFIPGNYVAHYLNLYENY